MRMSEIDLRPHTMTKIEMHLMQEVGARGINLIFQTIATCISRHLERQNACQA